MREATDRVVGVIDSDGGIVASTDLSIVGQTAEPHELPEEAGDIISSGGRTYKSLNPTGRGLNYVVFADGEDEYARTICSLAYVAAQEAKLRYDESNDRTAFIKSILSDNVLPGDIYVRSREFGFVTDTPRAVILVRQTDAPDLNVLEIAREMFPDIQNDFVVSMSERDVAIIAVLPENEEEQNLQELSGALARRMRIAGAPPFVIGVGSPANSLRELADKYKEAQVSIEVGKVFDTDRTIIHYESLGIGRLIYQLPKRLCEMFLAEVFKKNPIEALDAETLYTINKFFENNLNVSETSRRLFVHRNTLVYRLEKIKKITGLDLRELDHAIVFKVALMVTKYLKSQGKGGFSI
ncbi:MAG: helix-turn-helix domain-containing protein [Oscillospiraceae bacterium]|jgi:carbohydrate diacid regulator|nr:helix-turn-helix domain-containing protein [Oscillospiraceae bacterium]